MDDDLLLLQRWRGGDRSAGEALCARYFDEIYGFFQHKLPDDADDLTQQTFLACVRARAQFRGDASFRTYLFAIARNELYMRLRRGLRRDHVDLNVSSLEELVSSPREQLGKKQELARLLAALRKLPLEQQVLLEYHYWYGQDTAALALIFEATPGAIRVRLTRARQALRARLAALGGPETPSDDPLSISLREPDVDGEGGTTCESGVG